MKEEGIRRKDRYIYGTVSGFQTLQTGAQVSTVQGKVELIERVPAQVHTLHHLSTVPSQATIGR